MRLLKSMVCIAALLVFAMPVIGESQSFRRGGGEFNALRTVTIGPGRPYTVVVSEFFHHGEIAPDGRNVIVVADQRLVPYRVLQLGPGDFCRLAFQPIKGQLEYEILYGGDPPVEIPPAWTSEDGLLLETRHFKNCNLQNLDALRKAFQSSPPFGSDYVPGVFHSGNPFSLKREPFFSRYSGYLDIPTPGKYGFWTSSQDASFLLIDDRLVASAPGRHRPMFVARPGTRQDVQLSAGLHKFEYYHAAAGADAIMSAAWEPNPENDKYHPQSILPRFFNVENVGRLPAKNLTLRKSKLTPDFSMVIDGEAPLPDRDTPLIDVLFRNNSPKTLTDQAKIRWDFGDGQTSEELNPEHVYLLPGLYTVRLSMRHNGRTYEIANRLEIGRLAYDFRDKPHTLDDYLKLLETYNPAALSAPALGQLMLVYEAKAAKLLNRAEDVENQPLDPNRKPDDIKDRARRQKNIESLTADAWRYLSLAMKAGQAAFTGQSVAGGDEELIKLARHLDLLARCRLGDSPNALQIWQTAAERIKIPTLKAECQIAAADILINDLLKAQDSKALLDEAAAALGKDNTGPLAASLQRVWGDYYAAVGNEASARNAYLTAEQVLPPGRNFSERAAWKGAHSRSAEEFIKAGKLDRAAEEIQAWQREFPGEKIDGYLTLLWARFWAAREKYDQAVAQAEQLLAVNPNSAYADQIMFLAADCELRRGKKDRALATLRSIMKDYPGSPLVPLVKKNLEELEKR